MGHSLNVGHLAVLSFSNQKKEQKKKRKKGLN